MPYQRKELMVIDKVQFLPLQQIRVFTFVVGPPQYRVEELKDMACENKGNNYIDSSLLLATVGKVMKLYI